MIPCPKKNIKNSVIYHFDSFWLLLAILDFENANKGTLRDNSDIDSRHTELTFLMFSSFYIFVPFKYIKVI